jgi:mutator protein MutT
MPVHVVAAAVTDADGRVLIAQRPAGKQLAGRWEFPGGKVEPGENRVQALTRELQEELGIRISGHPRPLIRVHHEYPFGKVLIDMWVVGRYEGEPRGLDGQALRWCHQDELEHADLLPADRPLIEALRLPERLSSVTSLHYTVGGPDSVKSYGRLRGILCASAAEGLGVADRGVADFLVMLGVIPEVDLIALCHSVDVPVFARAASLEHAWSLGASGVNDIWSASR